MSLTLSGCLQHNKINSPTRTQPMIILDIGRTSAKHFLTLAPLVLTPTSVQFAGPAKAAVVFTTCSSREERCKARPVAQLVERWIPGSESPGSRRSGARYMKLLVGMARLVGAAAAS